MLKKLFRNSFRDSYENLNGRKLNLDLKEHEIDEVVLTMFLTYCKNNNEEEHYWKPYADFLGELPKQGIFRHMRNDYYNTVLITIKEIYKSAKSELKKRYQIRTKMTPDIKLLTPLSKPELLRLISKIMR